MIDAIRDHLLMMVAREVRAFLKHLGIEGEVCRGFTYTYDDGSSYYEDDVLAVLDDFGHARFFIHIDMDTEITYSGVMNKDNRAPKQEGRARILISEVTLVDVLCWGLGI